LDFVQVALLETGAGGRSGGASAPWRCRAGVPRSFPTPVSTGSGSKGLSQPRHARYPRFGAHL